MLSYLLPVSFLQASFMAHAVQEGNKGVTSMLFKVTAKACGVIQASRDTSSSVIASL